MSDNSTSAGGITLGSVIAALLSWTVNHSIGYCVLHFLCGWFYVIWYAVNYIN